jgi:hypothetical protein
MGPVSLIVLARVHAAEARERLDARRQVRAEQAVHI